LVLHDLGRLDKMKQMKKERSHYDYLQDIRHHACQLDGKEDNVVGKSTKEQPQQKFPRRCANDVSPCKPSALFGIRFQALRAFFEAVSSFELYPLSSESEVG
jgi:hypothetical protein